MICGDLIWNGPWAFHGSLPWFQRAPAPDAPATLPPYPLYPLHGYRYHANLGRAAAAERTTSTTQTAGPPSASPWFPPAAVDDGS